MIASAYVSREIDLEPPLVSAMVLGWDGSRLVVSPSRPGSPVRARLLLDRQPEQAGGDPLQVASRQGILWVGLFPVRVYLECAVWSDSESTLGLRPSNLRWPVGTARYARAAVAVLEELGEWLTTGIRGPASPPTVEHTPPETSLAAA
jgi:hypothetical protein